MKKVDIYNIEGKKTADLALNAQIFDVEANDALLHQVYVAQSANRRSGNAHTKIRSDVRGGGRKPWKQKGTGNARTGSIRNPIWRGGGVTFGPLKGKNFSKSINNKMKRKALLVALSEKVRNDKLRVVDSLKMDDVKTKIVVGLLNGMEISKSSTIGFSMEEKGGHLAARNIEKVNAMETDQLNVFDVLNSEYLVLSKDSVKQLEAKYVA